MNLLTRLFGGPKTPTKSSAQVAKERLQIIVTHEGNPNKTPDYLPKMKQEMLNVIRKYVPINEDQIDVSVANNGRFSVLELNVTLNEMVT